MLLVSAAIFLVLRNRSRQSGFTSSISVEESIQILCYLMPAILGIESLFRLRTHRAYLILAFSCLICYSLFHNLQHKLFGYASFGWNAESMITEVELYGNGRFVSYNTLGFESIRTGGYYEIDNTIVRLWQNPPTDFPKKLIAVPREQVLRFEAMDFNLGHRLLQNSHR